MLIQLTPEQVASNWFFLQQCIADGGPLEDQKAENRENNILESLLIGDMQCWAETVFIDNKSHIRAIVLTQVLENTCAGVRNLLIYSLHGFNENWTLSDWGNSLLTLSKFAKKKNCQHVITYTANEQLLNIARKLNGNTSQRVVVLNLN